jgi:hypothetical protein
MQDMNEEQVNGHKGLVTIAEKVIPKAQGEAREAAANAAERAAAGCLRKLGRRPPR